MQNWQGIQNVVVVGLGITGLSVVSHLDKLPHSLSIKVIDTRDNPPGVNELPKNMELHLGSWRQEWLNQADLIVVNPGIALATLELQQAISLGVKIVGDIELFAWAVEKPVIAITGSNGKSTVTDLTGQMAKALGVKVAVGGNIGVSALDLLELEADLYVLELSSFQLETTSSLKPQVATFLNLSEDHMDRYMGMEDYRQAKLRIFSGAKNKLVNFDDKATYPESDTQNVVEFGVESGRYHLLNRDGRNWLTKQGEPIIAGDELSLVGQHNQLNALVAVALLDLSGFDVSSALDALRHYQGLTHRCQVVNRDNGVVWVNDSKATNVASTLAAIKGLQVSGKLYLLVGGDGKGADFSELKPALDLLNVQLCCFGEDGDKLLFLSASSLYFKDMSEVIALIRQQLKSGDMVMLSPACASFDQFANFMQRGDYFTELACLATPTE